MSNKNTIVVNVEGNLAVGKSSLIDSFKDNNDFDIV
jgi:deoxyadenosine/deoxycytidine kinase